MSPDESELVQVGQGYSGFVWVGLCGSGFVPDGPDWSQLVWVDPGCLVLVWDRLSWSRLVTDLPKTCRSSRPKWLDFYLNLDQAMQFMAHMIKNIQQCQVLCTVGQFN